MDYIKKEKLIPLWPNNPINSTNISESEFPEKYIFPSGRQALTHCLRHAGLSRKNRVAIPEWSSHCVVSAVGKIADPIPMQEVLAHSLDVKAVLIYDQWGWPVFNNSYKHLESRFSNKILIHDQVDTSNIVWYSDNAINEKKYSNYKSVYQIFSLSKTLGLIGGGIARKNEKWLEPLIDKNQENLIGSLDKLKNTHELNNNLISNFMKNDIGALPNGLRDWLKRNDISKSYEMERNQRIKNVSIILNSSLAKGWPDWLIRSVKDKNVPGIVPLFSELDDDEIFDIQKKLVSSFNIETEIYHFDFNGNPIKPNYKKCIAFPIHGMINLDLIIQKLFDIIK